MQDKQNEYIDHAWNEMRKLLDQEMPVRRRRPVWWWWVGAAGLLGVLWTGWYTWSQWQMEEPDVVNASAKKAEKETAKSDLAPADAVKLPADQSLGVKKEDVSPKRSEGLPAVNRSAGGAPQASAGIGEEHESSKIIDIVGNHSQNDGIAGKGKDTEGDFVPSISPMKGTLIAPVTNLPSVLIGEVAISGPSLPPTLFAMALPAKTNWSFGAEVALTSDIRSGITGGFIGLTSAWQHRRWSVHSGLGWARQDLSTSRGNFVNESLSADAPNPNMAPEQSLIPQPPSSLVVRSSQLRLPLYVAYHLSPRWQVGAGVDVRYWLQARQQWSYAVNLDPTLQFDAAESYGALLGQSGDPIPRSAVNRWDVAPMLQVTYLINDRWQWGMGTRLGLRNMSKIGNVAWYDRSFWVGGKIHF